MVPPFAADYPFLNVLWSMLIFMAFLLWIFLAVTCFSDIFRRHDMGGFMKAVWVVLIILVPYLGVLIYLIAYNHGMAERNQAQSRAMEKAFDERVREASGKGAATEIAEAQRLRESGAITDEEFAQLKAKALAT
jgi:hypothetical protein